MPHFYPVFLLSMIVVMWCVAHTRTHTHIHTMASFVFFSTTYKTTWLKISKRLQKCSYLPLIVFFPWDAIAWWVHGRREQVETGGQWLTGVFSGHCAHYRTNTSQVRNTLLTFTELGNRVAGLSNEDAISCSKKDISTFNGTFERAVWQTLE